MFLAFQCLDVQGRQREPGPSLGVSLCVLGCRSACLANNTAGGLQNPKESQTLLVNYELWRGRSTLHRHSVGVLSSFTPPHLSHLNLGDTCLPPVLLPQVESQEGTILGPTLLFQEMP